MKADLRAGSSEDWLAPLYSCARKHQQSDTVSGLWYAAREYYFLETYRDSPERLDECCQELQSRFDDTSGRALGAKDYLSSLKACGELEQFEQTGIGGYEKTASESRERKQLLALAQQKKTRRKQHALAGFAAAVVILIVCCGAYVFGYLQPAIWKQAVKQEAEEDYEGALYSYSRLLIGPWSKQADTKMIQMKEQLGARYLEEGRYDQALALFQELGDEKGIQKVHFARGEALREEGLFEEAVEQFALAEAPLQERDAYLKWTGALEEEERYHEAVTTLKHMWKDIPADYLPKEEEYLSRLSVLQEKRCDAAIAQVTGSGTDGPIDTEQAFLLGSTLDDLKGQLRFCAALDAAGADLNRIYPEGTVIDDVSLLEYQPFGDENTPGASLEESRPGQEEKVLVFSRTEQAPPGSSLLTWTLIGTGESAAQDKDDSDYTVRFLPGKWQALSEQRRAADWEECDRILLVDSIYRKNGVASLIQRVKVGTGSTGTSYTQTHYYPLFDVIDNITIYRKDAPEQFFRLAAQRSRPEGADKYGLPGLVMEYTGSFNDIDYSRFRGKSDQTFLRKEIEKAIAFLNG